MILLITRRDDLTADFLIQRLLTRGIPYLRFDIDHYLDDISLSAEFDGRGVRGEIVTPQGTAPLSAVRAVWYRRAMSPRLGHLGMSPGDQGFAERESRHFLEGVIGSLSARWVNPWPAVHVWERKLAQLPLASACGLPVPHTLVATDTSRLSAFATEISVVAKAIGQGYLETEHSAESIYTHAVPAERLSEAASARLCPTLIQERLPKVADIRLTVVGRRLFAARIDAELPDGLDWRRPGTPIQYSPITVPQHIADAVGAIMERSSLRYGAFDFALLPDARWVFLEVNPAGEFAWIEEKLGFPLRDALIDELLGEDVP